ncbi:MAG: hypothetical protein MK171_06835 [Pirellulales bacterium]|nr:hypothetical protein [Pirellulales bacterium]
MAVAALRRTGLVASTWTGLMAVLVAVLATRGEIVAEDAPHSEENTALVRVRLPITGTADQALQKTLARTCDALLAQARRRGAARRPLLVLQLDSPSGNQAERAGSQFERVLSLAKFLCSRQMAGVKTVAFVPRSIRGHGSLLAFACEEIAMSPDALLGQAAENDNAPKAILGMEVTAYRGIAETRRTIPVALAVGMVDAHAEVLQIETAEGDEFVLGRDLESFAANHVIASEKVLVPRGTLAQFDGREGRQFGFVKYLASNREGLARVLGLPPAALREHDVLAAHWQPVMVDVAGALTPRLASQVETIVGRELEGGQANWIGVRIDSSGGDLAASVRLATFLAHLDANTVRTVAYVPAEATGGAALVALSCHQLVMHSGARLQARSADAPPHEAGFPASLQAARTSIRDSLAPQAEKNWSLLTAMIDPSVVLFQYRNKTTGEKSVMSVAEAAGREDAQQWQQTAPVQENEATLSLEGARAQQLDLAWQTVESIDDLKQAYGFDNDPRTLKPNWALEFIEALASPGVAGLLIAISLWGIYFELRAPGIGVGAFVCTLGLMLFFWSMYLNGTAGWLETILLLGGICFILLEIFVLPGFGIFGLGGTAMVIAALVLASVTFVFPQSEAEIAELTRSVGTIAVAAFGVMSLVLISRRYLPQAPIFRNFVLESPTSEEQAVLREREALVDYSNLIGQRGMVTVALRPAGKAEIDHELINVIAEGEPLARGTPIVVVDAHANRVVVRAVGPA